MTAMVNCPCCKRAWRAPPKRRVPVAALRYLAFRYVEEKTGVTQLEMSSGRRAHRLVEARALFVWIAKTFGPRDLSYPTIGEWLGKDHSSVQHEWKQIVPRLLENDADFAVHCAEFGPWAVDLMEYLPCN